MIKDSNLLDRITVRPEVFGDKPIIRDMRIAVEHVLSMLAVGDSEETILREYPILEPEDIRACLLIAYRSMAGEDIYERAPIRQSAKVSRLKNPLGTLVTPDGNATAT